MGCPPHRQRSRPSRYLIVRWTIIINHITILNIYVRICLRVHVAWGHRGQTLLLSSSHSVRFLLRLPRRELLASVAKEPRRGPDDGRGAGAGASVSAFAARSIRWYDFQRRRGGLPVARPIVVVRPLCVRPAAPSSSSVLCPSAPSFVIRPLSVRPPFASCRPLVVARPLSIRPNHYSHEVA